MGKALLVISVLVLTIYAFYDVLATPKGAARRMPKWAWAVLAFVPVIGPILWLCFGRPRRRAMPQRRPRDNASGPDDDPDFLRDLNRNPEDVLEEWEKEYRRKRRAHGEDPER
ncbi:PLD nuclease N-terminal domain-containing protein [Solicola gregarius]|uniref:PLD nuclease N-terminal domain-containing protein n=1 Tax=Solicola gregarius TaxID=2908642 RepID=A0AA46TM31_9ACTN|nr:PLD nuclease N-terminal domain-containing protein [Solicola gregarius]UYM06923.1 PLD nuclease N-terminal domain-containing protein [Solicola gregarius]